MLVDSHCHLDFPELYQQKKEVLERASLNDVRLLQTICTKITEADRIIAIAEAHDSVFCSIGIHPHEVEKQPKLTLEILLEWLEHEKVIGVGETGLDYYYEHSPKALQAESFRIHIQASRETGLPIIIHTRDADEDTVEILKDEMKQGIFPGLIHCFSTTEYLAQEAIKMGMYISVAGIVTFKKAHELREIIKTLPLERLLVETDAPFLAPVPCRGKTNEPSFVRHTAEFLADLKGVSYEDVARVTTRNFFELFSKVPKRMMPATTGHF